MPKQPRGSPVTRKTGMKARGKPKINMLVRLTLDENWNVSGETLITKGRDARVLTICFDFEKHWVWNPDFVLEEGMFNAVHKEAIQDIYEEITEAEYPGWKIDFDHFKVQLTGLKKRFDANLYLPYEI